MNEVNVVCRREEDVFSCKPNLLHRPTRGRRQARPSRPDINNQPLLTFLESKTNLATAIGQKLRQMWQQGFSQSALTCHWARVSEVEDTQFEFVNFRLASRPQDVCLGPDEGDVGPADGHSKKRWVIKSLNQEVIPHFKMNVVFKSNPFTVPTSVGWLSIFWFNSWLLRRFIFTFCSYRIQLCATRESLFF